MYELTEKLRGLVPYDPITGDYKIRLDANESFIKITENEIKNAVQGIALNRYPDPYAMDALNAFSARYGVSADYLTAGNGSDELISIITACFFQKGDKVVCLAPDFSMYSFYPYLYELDVDIMNKKDDLTIDTDALIKRVNDTNAKAVIFSNPCNPTSLGLERSDVLRLVKSVKALVVLDEAYMEFWDESNSLLGDIKDFDNLIILKTCSKALAMAGLRLGFATAGKSITSALRAAKSPYNVNSVTQAIGSYVMRDTELLSSRIAAVKSSIKKLYDGIIGLNCPAFEKIYPTNTNFVFIKTARAKEIYNLLLDNSIAVRFMGGYLRINCGTDEENEAVLSVLGNVK